MKKGFTLIELLAVIVILAIIALIATPIILGIINDAREESKERSVELYAAAVKNGIAAHQLTKGEVLAGIYTEENPLPFEVASDGEVVCERVEIYEDGGVYVSKCIVNGVEVDYTYGTKQQFYKPQYYSISNGYIGDNLPNDAKENILDLNITGKLYYLGFDTDSNNKISEAYLCFVRNETEYCMKGASVELYEINKGILEDAFEDNENSCTLQSDRFICSDNILNAFIMLNDGAVYADNNFSFCAVTPIEFGCMG